MERQVRNRYPTPSCLKELEQVLMEEWPTIPLAEVKKLYDSIRRRIEAVQKAGQMCDKTRLSVISIYIYLFLH